MQRLIRSAMGRLGFVIKRKHSGVKRRVAQSSARILPQNLLLSIHGKNIYEDFAFDEIPSDLSGWGGNSPAFDELIEKVRPGLIIEVGSWKGASAITMARALESRDLQGKILCIDTWLGALEFWMDKSDPERFQSLGCRNGYPQVYFQFLANVCHRNQQDRIVPFPLDSSSAALWLLTHGVTANLIYIDGSHEEEAVYQDLLDYSSVLAPGGILFGDDWEWSGVRSAVERFSRETRLPISHCHDKWVLGDTFG